MKFQLEATDIQTMDKYVCVCVYFDCCNNLIFK